MCSSKSDHVRPSPPPARPAGQHLNRTTSAWPGVRTSRHNRPTSTTQGHRNGPAVPLQNLRPQAGVSDIDASVLRSHLQQSTGEQASNNPMSIRSTERKIGPKSVSQESRIDTSAQYPILQQQVVSSSNGQAVGRQHPQQPARNYAVISRHISPEAATGARAISNDQDESDNRVCDDTGSKEVSASRPEAFAYSTNGLTTLVEEPYLPKKLAGFGNLLVELLLQIIGYLKVRDMESMRRTCVTMREVIKLNSASIANFAAEKELARIQHEWKRYE